MGVHFVAAPLLDSRRSFTQRAGSFPWRGARSVVIALMAAAPALTWTLTVGPAEAQPRADESCPPPPLPTGQAAENRARKIFQYAVGIEATQPREAFDLYKCARRLSDRPVIALRLGTLAETLGDTDTALVALTNYLELAGADAPDADDIRKRLEALRETKRASEPGVVVSGTPIEDASLKKPVKADPAPATSSGGASTRTLAGLATAGAGVVVAGISGYLLYDARAKSEELAKTPPGRVFWDSPQGEGKLQTARGRQTLGIVGVSVGGALIVGGLVVWLTGSPPKQVEMTAGPLPGGFAAGTSVRF